MKSAEVQALQGPNGLQPLSSISEITYKILCVNHTKPLLTLSTYVSLLLTLYL